MKADREGRFRAHVMDVGVNETGPNKLCTIVLRFALIEEYANGEWRNIESEELDAVAYCYVEKRDGSLNDFQVEALKEAFGWPGIDPFWFEENKELPPVQVTLQAEEYNGKERIKVQFINSYDSEPGGITHADADTRRAMLARLGHKLRAHSGGKPAPAPKATGAPTPPPKAAPAAEKTPAAPAPAAKPTSTMDAVWALFAKWAVGKGASQDELNKTWFDAIKAVCGHEDADKVMPEQWAQVAEKLPIPF